MALIDVYGSTSNTYRLRIVVTETTKEAGSASYPGGRTLLTSVLRLYCGGQYFQSFTCSGNHKVGGSTLWTASGQYSLPSANSSIALDTSTKWIVHAADGTASVSVSGAFQTVDQTPSYKCPPISVSASSALTPNTVYVAGNPVPAISLPATVTDFNTAMTNAGFIAGSPIYSGVSMASPGKVASYSPSAGQTAAAGSTITPTCYLTQNAIPDLTGKTEADARATLAAAGFNVSTTTVSTTTSSLNNTVSDWGYKGQTRPIGETVNVVLYKFQTVAMPNVVGMTQTTAVSAIVGTGLASPTISYTETGATAQNSGLVKSQDPVGIPEGTVMVALGSATSIVIYRLAGLSIPNVVGGSLSAAQTTLVNAGFGTPTVTYSGSGANGENSGTVKSQSPIAGTVSPPGTATSVVIYKLTGQRMTGSSTKTSLTVAKRYANDTDGWVGLKVLKRYNGTSWVEISN
jgi:beta-lactam-binding protein with PASTA domain